MSTMTVFACFLVLFTATFTPAARGKYHLDSQIVDEPVTINRTNLRFFLHNTLSGDNPSAVLVAKQNGTVVEEGHNVPFGAVYVYDDWLTVGSDPDSEVIGNARGMYSSTNRGPGITLLFSGDFEFTSGEFNGSTISVFSRDPVTYMKELAVVGGTGKFRMAKGFILATTTYFNATTGDGIFEFNTTIFHHQNETISSRVMEPLAMVL